MARRRIGVAAPAEFRDSFMHRNPVNRDLLAAASRLGSRDTLLR